jgi:hypothetical protein
MRWAKASLLELTVSEKSKFYPLKLDLLNYRIILLVLVLVFWYQSKLGFDLPEKLATGKILSRYQKMR